MMTTRARSILVLGAVFSATTFVGACFKSTFVVVPHKDGGYRLSDTLRAAKDGNDYRVTFYTDTLRLTRTVYRTDTLYRDTLRRVDTVRLVRRDTVRILRRDTLRRVDTVRVGPGFAGIRTDTVRLRVYDTVRVFTRDTLRITDVVYVNSGRTDTVRAKVDTLRLYVPVEGPARYRIDTVRVFRVDTVRMTLRDTVRVTVHDTVRVSDGAGGMKREIKIPPGQYPPEGQCRVWIPGVPPGRQSPAAPCDKLGSIPAGAFVLFGGEAYDFDYDWVADGKAPAQIIALKRKRP